MSTKKVFMSALVCVAMLFSLCVQVGAIGKSEDNATFQLETGIAASDAKDLALRASGSFNMMISGNTIVATDTKFPLEAGEVVSIRAAYTPPSASVDFGIIAPDGKFYALNTSNGSFNKGIRVNERGWYTMAVRNNASSAIYVSGYVNY